MAIQLILPGLTLPAAAASSATAPRANLWRYPHLDTETLCAHACALGAAGEALVDSISAALRADPAAGPAGPRRRPARPLRRAPAAAAGQGHVLAP